MYQTSQCKSEGYSPALSGRGCGGPGCRGFEYGGLESIAGSMASLRYDFGSSSAYSPSGGDIAGNAAYALQSFVSSSYGGAREFFRSESPCSSRFLTHGNNLTYENNVQYQPDEAAASVAALKAEYHFIPDDFLKPGREGKFVGQAGEIKGFVEETFEKLFNEKFPEDIKVSILSAEKFQKLASHPSTIGLSINRRRQGLLSEIFVLNDSLGRVMLTIGHELGHVLTPTLDKAHDEEAKAYAFSLEWMRIIRENNIGDLGGAIVTERPADNGLHNIAFFFVERLIKIGKEAGEIYAGLIRGMINVPVSG